MSLPSYVVPVLEVGGPVALVLAILSNFPKVARGLMILVAGITAVVTSDEDRRKSCHKVLSKVTRRDYPPWPRRRPIGRGRSSR